MDSHRGLKPHTEPKFLGPQVIIGLLSRLVLRVCPQAHSLVKRAYGIGYLAAQEATCRKCAIQNELLCAKATSFRPSWSNGVIVGVAKARKQPIELYVIVKPSIHNSQQVFWIPAVVVGERDNLALGEWQTGVPRPRQAARGAEMAYRQAGMALQQRYHSLVWILINNDYLEVPVRLGIEADHQPVQLI